MRLQDDIFADSFVRRLENRLFCFGSSEDSSGGDDRNYGGAGEHAQIGNLLASGKTKDQIKQTFSNDISQATRDAIAAADGGDGNNTPVANTNLTYQDQIMRIARDNQSYPDAILRGQGNQNAVKDLSDVVSNMPAYNIDTYVNNVIKNANAMKNAAQIPTPAPRPDMNPQADLASQAANLATGTYDEIPAGLLSNNSPSNTPLADAREEFETKGARAPADQGFFGALLDTVTGREYPTPDEVQQGIVNANNAQTSVTFNPNRESMSALDQLAARAQKAPGTANEELGAFGKIGAAISNLGASSASKMYEDIVNKGYEPVYDAAGQIVATKVPGTDIFGSGSVESRAVGYDSGSSDDGNSYQPTAFAPPPVAPVAQAPAPNMGQAPAPSTPQGTFYRPTSLDTLNMNVPMGFNFNEANQRFLNSFAMRPDYYRFAPDMTGYTKLL